MQLIGPDRPFLVIDIEFGCHMHQLDVGLEEGIDRTHVAPVVLGARFDITERIGKHLQVLYCLGDDVFAEVMR